jgi:RimJ/RimL family protein N-acetyltransferase
MVFVSVRPVTAADVAEFVEWRYESPFDAYDLTQSATEAVGYFLSPAVQCHVLETDGGLAGYCTFGEDARVPGGDYAVAALDIGAALRPDLTGHGHGTRFVAAILGFAAARFGRVRARVSIASTNVRALRVWKANGFAETQRFDTQREVLGTTEFVVLERVLAATGEDGASAI